MCVVSSVGDHYRKTIPEQFPWVDGPWDFFPDPTRPRRKRNPQTVLFPGIPNIDTPSGPSQEEFDALKKLVEQMKKELEEAKRQDIADGNPDCEMEEKVAFIRKIADAVGVDLEEIFGKPVDNKSE